MVINDSKLPPRLMEVNKIKKFNWPTYPTFFRAVKKLKKSFIYLTLLFSVPLAEKVIYFSTPNDVLFLKSDNAINLD